MTLDAKPEAAPLTDEFLTGLLSRLLSRYGGSQVLLFGGGGEPFWAARPITRNELALFENALHLIESLESDHPKPFLGHDPRGRFVVAAVDSLEDLYIVVFGDDGSQPSAEARVVAYRDELRVHANAIRGQRAANETEAPG